MNVFVLHAGQPELAPFLRSLRVPNGTARPKPSGGLDEMPWLVLPWRADGDRSGTEPERYALQPRAAVRRAANPRAMAETLRLHGIRVADGSGRADGALVRKFVVPVLQLEALGSFSSGGALVPDGRFDVRRFAPSAPDSNESGGPGRSTAARRAERAAVRAVYALGLDYAVVTVRSDAFGRALVEAVDPSPDAAAGPFAALFAEAVNRLSSSYALAAGEGGATLGADPEFVLRRPGPDGKIVSASRYFDRQGRVGCDSVRVGDRLVYPLAELRPSPSAEPEALFRNLYAAMRLAASRIDDASLEWLAGGMPAKGLPLGGHIHVSGVALNADLLRAMDNYLALPLVLLEDESTKRRRPRYGALGDFRRQFHGGFEYRTLPSWIVSPSVARGVLALAKVVCEHYRELRERPLARPEMQAHYYAGRKDEIRSTAERLWRDVERTASYARYAKPLERLKRRILRMESWNEQQDLRVLWKLHP